MTEAERLKDIELSARAEDLNDLLGHIAWTDTIKPRLDKVRDYYSNLLVKAVLGTKVVIPSAMGPQELTTGQIAGRVEGIDYIMSLFEEILRKGERALKELHINSNG